MKIELQGLEREYWLGTEAGRLGCYDFSEETWAGDGSANKGEMGAGSACLQRQNKCLVARVGREEEGVKTLLPDWQQWLGHYRLHHRKSTFFSPRHYDHILPHARRVFASSLSTGPPRDHGALHCHWIAIATKPIGQRVPVQTRGILHGPEEQSWPRGGKSIGVTDQPQYPRL